MAQKKAAESFIAGILAKIEEMTLFLNPIANSYERFGSFEAPLHISWSHQNRSQLVRIPAAQGEFSRMELRSPDPSANPYIAFALLINAGLDGINDNLELPDPVNLNLYKASEADLKDIKTLPKSFGDAIEIVKNSAFVKKMLGESMLSKFIEIKMLENTEFNAASNKWEFFSDRYFRFI